METLLAQFKKDLVIVILFCLSAIHGIYPKNKDKKKGLQVHKTADVGSLSKAQEATKKETPSSSEANSALLDKKDSEATKTSLSTMFADKNFQEFLSLTYKEFHAEQKNKAQRTKEEEERKRFYTEYLEKYYPKVFVIRRQFFSHMTIDQVIPALQEIIEIFTEKPWFYFTNKKEEFVIVRYWEYIVDQLSFISDFFRKTYIDPLDNKIISPDQISRYGSPYMMNRALSKANRPILKSFFSVLNDRQKRVVHQFYALCFDYLIKLFNEGILLKDSRLANRFLQDLNFVADKLQGSEFEADYQEVLKTCKELLKILEHKYGLDAYEDLDDDSMMSSDRRQRY